MHSSGGLREWPQALKLSFLALIPALIATWIGVLTDSGSPLWFAWLPAVSVVYSAVLALNVADSAGVLAEIVERRQPFGSGSSSWFFSRGYFRVVGAVGTLVFTVVLGVVILQPI